ncbi:MAG: T9SS type A sorting domain-containing protein [Chitinophagaceae bacterium]|nr:T9SS type A sorting domain-containing protein [Chitinophagaceae bacterium]
MKTLYPTVKTAAVTFLLFIGFIFSSHLSFGQFVFKNSKIANNGADGAIGTVYRFPKIAAGIDALVSIDSLVNGSSLKEIDQQGTGFNDAFQPRIQSGNDGVSYIVFTVRFVVENTNTLKNIPLLTVTNLDLDGNPSLKEMCEFNMDGGIVTFMSNTPEIKVTGADKKFLGQNVAGVEYPGIDTTADAVMFKVRRANVSRFTIRLGAISNNSNAARQYSVYFKDFGITNAVSLPLTLLNFDAFLKTDKVNLSWTTTEQRNFSHFILQRSSDARNFKEVMMLMTDPVSITSVNNYTYTDKISDANATTMYYRLQMVDVDGKFQYSPIRMIRLNATNNITVQTFPNPATSELRVMIPASWQEKSTVYEIYNSNGILVSRTNVARAAQVQQLNVQSLGSGNYIIRVTNGSEISSSKFIKL